jgi:hypothetical protein
MSIINVLFERLDPFLVQACVRVSGLARSRRTFHTGGDPYLTRFYLTKRAVEQPLDPNASSKAFGVYLHYFHRGDDDAALHNHPWGWSFSIIFTNGYVEERWDPKARRIQRRILRPGSINVIRANDFHRVDLLDQSRGAWTLFFSGERVREEWGFWLPGVHKFIPHLKFVRSRSRNVRLN